MTDWLEPFISKCPCLFLTEPSFYNALRRNIKFAFQSPRRFSALLDILPASAGFQGPAAETRPVPPVCIDPTLSDGGADCTQGLQESSSRGEQERCGERWVVNELS